MCGKKVVYSGDSLGFVEKKGVNYVGEKSGVFHHLYQFLTN